MPQPYICSDAPHIHDSASVRSLYWTGIFSCLPIVAAAGFAFGGRAFFQIALGICAGLLAEFAASFLLRRNTALRNGNTVSISLIFALCLPVETPWWLVTAGAFLTVFLFKEITGGLGSSVFSPALAGALMVKAMYPLALSGAAASFSASAWREIFLSPFSYAGIGEISLVALFITYLVLSLARVICWELPLLFFAIYIPGILIQGATAQWQHAVFAAILLLTDHAGLPATRTGKRLSALAAGLLSTWLARSLHGTWCAILMTGFLAHKMDGFRSGKSKKKQPETMKAAAAL